MDTIIIDILRNSEIKEISEILPEEKLNKLIIKLEKIKKSVLYDSYFHGLHHSQKVCIFTTLLAHLQGLSEEETELVMDAAIYHDMGRENDNEEAFHGMIGANKILKVLNNPIYDEKENQGYIRSIVDLHSVGYQGAYTIIYESYKEEYPKLEYNKYEKLANVLLDADALDRTRFRKTSIAALNEKYLRSNLAKNLIPLAEKINYILSLKIDQINIQSLTNYTSHEEREFIHGIGHNFFVIGDILEKGILSVYEAEKENVGFVSNFNGNNNGRLWVSVVDKENKAEAHDKFIKNKIAFHVKTKNWCDPLSHNVSKSRDLGLSKNSGEYTDERFVLGKIDRSSIEKLELGNEFEKLKSLNYLNCSFNIDVIKNKLSYYIKQIEENCKVHFDYTEATKIVNQYERAVIDFEKQTIGEQKLNHQNFIVTCANHVAELNKLVQVWVSSAFSYALKKPISEVNLKDAVEFLLYKKDISFNLENGQINLNNIQK